MGKHYRQITMDEREVIAKLHYEGKKPREIAGAVDRDKSTIIRELARNSSATYDCYTPCRANQRSVERRKGASRRPRLKNKTIRTYVHEKLTIGWSPIGRIGVRSCFVQPSTM